jgi:hypothetical protein
MDNGKALALEGDDFRPVSGDGVGEASGVAAGGHWLSRNHLADRKAIDAVKCGHENF